jgi:hypothetical protein
VNNDAIVVTNDAKWRNKIRRRRGATNVPTSPAWRHPFPIPMSRIAEPALALLRLVLPTKGEIVGRPQYLRPFGRVSSLSKALRRGHVSSACLTSNRPLSVRTAAIFALWVEFVILFADAVTRHGCRHSDHPDSCPGSGSSFVRPKTRQLEPAKACQLRRLLGRGPGFRGAKPREPPARSASKSASLTDARR